MKKFTVSILGAGSRGVDTYGSFMQECGDRFQIVALCDIDPKKLERAKKIFSATNISCFTEK